MAATATMLVVFDIDAGSSTTIPLTSPPDRIAIGGDADAGFVAYVLSGRVAPPQGATATCAGSSTVTAVPLGGGASMTVSTSAPLATSRPPAARCSARTVRGHGDPARRWLAELSMALTGASALAVEGVHLWAVGSTPSATDGAQIVVASIALDGTDPRMVRLAPKAEVMTFDGDPNQELAIDLHADTEVALDLAVLPGAQTVALIARKDSPPRPARRHVRRRVHPDDDGGRPRHRARLHQDRRRRRIRSKCQLTVPTPNNAEFPSGAARRPPAPRCRRAAR